VDEDRSALRPPAGYSIHPITQIQHGAGQLDAEMGLHLREHGAGAHDAEHRPAGDDRNSERRQAVRAVLLERAVADRDFEPARRRRSAIRPIPCCDTSKAAWREEAGPAPVRQGYRGTAAASRLRP
jgi:hypothetical protein